MNKGQIQISQFLNYYSSVLNLKNKALLKLSSFESIDQNLIYFDNELTETTAGKINTFDLVFADLPFGMNKEPFVYNKSKKVNHNWNLLAQSLRILSTIGTLFAVVEPAIYFSKIGKEFLNILETQGYFCNLLINAPEKLYLPKTAFNPIIIGVQKTQYNKIFIAEIIDNNFELIISNFRKQSNDNIQDGKWVDRGEFITFQKAKIENEIKGLQTQYKDYKNFQLADVSISINLTREIFNDLPNSVYIERVA